MLLIQQYYLFVFSVLVLIIHLIICYQIYYFIRNFSQINIYNFDSESYIWWIVVDMVVPISSKKLRNIWDTYVNEILQIEVRGAKSLECASDVNEIMGNCNNTNLLLFKF